MEIFAQTPLGRFLAGLRAEEQQELLQGYLKDFLLLTMRVSTCRELEVRTAGPGLWDRSWAGGAERGRRTPKAWSFLGARPSPPISPELLLLKCFVSLEEN